MRELDFLPPAYHQARQRRRLVLQGWLIFALGLATWLGFWLAR